MTTTNAKSIEPPALAAISGAPLRTPEGEKIFARSLWREKPAVVLVLRRPGCILCRAEAKKIHELKPQLEKMGFRVVCVVHEWLPKEIEAFTSGYWPGELYLDESRAFYKALNNGWLRRGNPLTFLNPWSTVWDNGKAAKESGITEYNLKGNGLIMGGMMVVRAGEGGVWAAWAEQQFGDHAPEDELLRVCKTVADAA